MSRGNIYWKEFRYPPIAEMYDVGICASSADCPRGFSENRHFLGYADNKGTIHWNGWYAAPTKKRGLHKLLCLIAVIKLKHHRRPGLPKWKAIHEREGWAQREGGSRFHVRFPQSYSAGAREEALADFRRRNENSMVDPTAYQWMHYPEYYESRKDKQRGSAI